MIQTGLENQTVAIFGVANKKSVAYHIGQALESAGASVIYIVRDETVKAAVSDKLLKKQPVYICNLENDSDINAVCKQIGQTHGKLKGVVHSVAYANYSDGFKPFHETNKADFLQATNISCFSLVQIANGLKDYLLPDASVITISISETHQAAESYGYMAPIKAALDAAISFLAKSFSRFSNVRFNAVKAGPLKTSASAGIPNYIENYLFAEQATLRKKAVQTNEVADVALFLLSDLSRGINAQGIVVDAGMSVNYFDSDIVKRVANTKDGSNG